MKSIFLLCLFTAITCCCQFTLQQDKEAPLFLAQVVKAVQEQHLQPKVIDDVLSKELYDFYLQQIDPNKEFLTQKDIRSLQQYENQIDEELSHSTFHFFNQTLKQLQKGIQKAEKYSQNALEKDLNFSSNEQFESNPDKLDYAANNQALKERWSKKVKYIVLQELWSIENASHRASFEEQKQHAISHAKRLLAIKFQKLKAISKQERLEEYTNAYLKINDVQTEYLSRAQKEKWNEDFTRTLVGIGAQIEIINEYPHITELIIGGPAWKSRQVEKGDVILKIGEDNQPAIDVLGKSIEEVISLLRGEKSSMVHLTLRKTNVVVEEIALVRDQIDLDPTLCFLLEDTLQNRKIGYIRLPRFYGGNEGCAAHVLAQLELLKANGVKGLVLDVRNNKGGSAREAISIMGYFLESGPVMQAKYRDGTHRVFEDTDGEVQYNGKLLVLTNAQSGSASELLAGTMQDYSRAVIVGGRATFGKGTIQRFVDVETVDGEDTLHLGEIKMTIGKFYTASGRSPQYEGIHPDIVLPDNDAFVESGERVYKYAFPPANLEITKVHQSVTSSPNLESLKSLHLQRLTLNQRFQSATQKAQQIKDLQDNTLVDLNYENFKLQQEKTANYSKYSNETFGQIEGFKVIPLLPSTLAQDSASILRNQRWIETLQRDPYVYECFWMVNDLLG
ncbi:MAG: carboxy terminal-processing peptidase [Chitinophagales bacterium]